MSVIVIAEERVQAGMKQSSIAERQKPTTYKLLTAELKGHQGIDTF
ncbi:hypothetical protein [Paenibacillus eucommiae]|uniref:Uncharacterized protein n=1 Tax=Paenibacillus eucommiae TaxID=1355755 RepID=A0ABS4IPU4_9BACL|nr:hypothetical protein [Paenibacillus eucommiae]MBP1989580.1 hypothetical protein [Paenibacillus eucommiae]